jgi:propanol-preferring alcohol dehydrogenase
MASACGICRFCRSGRENLCEKATFTGRDRDGGYAEKIVARAEWIYGLPAGFSAREAAPLLCAGIIGYRSLRLSGIQPGGRLGLFGFGASAHLAIQAALHWKCEVFAFTREEHHRRLALEMGAAWAGGGQDDPGVALDAAVTFAPAGSLVPVALSRLDRGGRLAINAIHDEPDPGLLLRPALRRAQHRRRHELHAPRRGGVPRAGRAHPDPARPRSSRSKRQTGRSCARQARGSPRGRRPGDLSPPRHPEAKRRICVTIRRLPELILRRFAPQNDNEGSAARSLDHGRMRRGRSVARN